MLKFDLRTPVPRLDERVKAMAQAAEDKVAQHRVPQDCVAPDKAKLLRSLAIDRSPEAGRSARWRWPVLVAVGVGVAVILAAASQLVPALRVSGAVDSAASQPARASSRSSNPLDITLLTEAMERKQTIRKSRSRDLVLKLTRNPVDS